ncbi:MAG: Type 1 glutamine amidotransferase-like domain-containing protein [Planctomycetes bacterium]|nr:Type 1 glutamine amidotransferase-like domain-containing protein [Planctomycetota bacterium]
MRRLLPAVLLPIALAAQAPPAPGTAILAGGGKLPTDIRQRFVQLAGGANARIVLIPTASGSADVPAENDAWVAEWQQRQPGATFALLHTRERATADDEAFCAPLRAATGVWLGGGAQDRLASAYLGTRVEKELMAVLARGGVVAGTSAGTAIQTRTMIQEGMDPPILATGFDCVPGAISDQHFLRRRRLPRLLQALAMRPGHFGLGVDEGTAAVVRGDHLEVWGDSKVVLALPAHHGHPALTVECEPGATVSLAPWRRAAGERAHWNVAEVAPPRLGAGTLLLGGDAGAVGRFVALAGGDQARIVVIALHAPAAEVETALLRAAPAAVIGIALVGDGGIDGADLDRALADATGLWLQDPQPVDSAILVDRIGAARLREGATRVLARGGVVWGSAALGEAIALDRSPGSADGGIGYRRGLGLLPGTAVHAPPRPAADADRAPSTDRDARLRACLAQLPRLTGIHVAGGAVVNGSTLEVVGDLPARVLPPRGDGDATATTVELVPGARYDLVTGARR